MRLEADIRHTHIPLTNKYTNSHMTKILPSQVLLNSKQGHHDKQNIRTFLCSLSCISLSLFPSATILRSCSTLLRSWRPSWRKASSLMLFSPAPDFSCSTVLVCWTCIIRSSGSCEESLCSCSSNCPWISLLSTLASRCWRADWRCLLCCSRLYNWFLYVCEWQRKMANCHTNTFTQDLTFKVSPPSPRKLLLWQPQQMPPLSKQETTRSLGLDSNRSRIQARRTWFQAEFDPTPHFAFYFHQVNFWGKNLAKNFLPQIQLYTKNIYRRKNFLRVYGPQKFSRWKYTQI